MSFGSPTPIEVAVSGPDFAASRTFAAKVQKQLAQVPTLCDLQYVQSLELSDDRGAGRSGAGRFKRRHDVGSRPGPRLGNVVEPICRSQLFARPEERRGLPGAGRNSHARHRLGQRHRHGPRAGAGRGAASGSRRGQRGGKHHAGRIRPLQHAARGEPDGQHQGGRPRARGQPRRPRRSSGPASRRAASPSISADKPSLCGKCFRDWASDW